MRHTQKLSTTVERRAVRERILDELAIFLAAASFVAILIASYGLDLSPGLF